MTDREAKEALRVLKLWADSLYECGATVCKAEERMHLKNFDAARPTLRFIEAYDVRRQTRYEDCGCYGGNE